jgi:hypothetical protein
MARSRSEALRGAQHTQQRLPTYVSIAIGMIYRVKIPTVLWANEDEILPQARLHVAFDDYVMALLPSQVEAAADWLELSERVWDHESAGELATLLRRGLAVLREKPPRLVPERYLGLVEAVDRAGAGAVYLDLSVETAVIEPSNPRIVLRYGETLERMSDTWWLLDGEAKLLAELVRERRAGVLTEAGPNQRPFLHVRPDGDGVTLRFEDEERGGGDIALAAAAADKLGELLAEALTMVVEQPPYVFVPPEPRDLLVAELHA